MKPQLFTVPGLDWDVQAYGFFIGLGLVLGFFMSLALARRDKLPSEVLGPVYVAAVAFALLGARISWLAQHPGNFNGWGDIIALQADGLTPAAGIVIALLVGGILAARRRVPVAAWYDVLMPAYALGIALEGIGALLSGTGFGRYAPSWPLAIRFNAGTPAFNAHQAGLAELMPVEATQSLPVHPTQIYATVMGVAALGLALWLRKRRRFSGQVFLAVAAFTLGVRSFVIEFFRADAPGGVIGPIGAGQLVVGAIVVALLIVYRIRSRVADKNPDALKLWRGGRWSPKELRPPEPTSPAASTSGHAPVRKPKKKKKKKHKRRRR